MSKKSKKQLAAEHNDGQHTTAVEGCVICAEQGPTKKPGSQKDNAAAVAVAVATLTLPVKLEAGDVLTTAKSPCPMVVASVTADGKYLLADHANRLLAQPHTRDEIAAHGYVKVMHLDVKDQQFVKSDIALAYAVTTERKMKRVKAPPVEPEGWLLEVLKVSAEAVEFTLQVGTCATPTAWVGLVKAEVPHDRAASSKAAIWAHNLSHGHTSKVSPALETTGMLGRIYKLALTPGAYELRAFTSDRAGGAEAKVATITVG